MLGDTTPAAPRLVLLKLAHNSQIIYYNVEAITAIYPDRLEVANDTVVELGSGEAEQIVGWLERAGACQVVGHPVQEHAPPRQEEDTGLFHRTKDNELARCPGDGGCDRPGVVHGVRRKGMAGTYWAVDLKHALDYLAQL